MSKPSTATKKRRKPEVQRKEESIRIRVTSEQKDILVAAAERAGLDVSSWLRALGIREAMRNQSDAP